MPKFAFCPDCEFVVEVDILPWTDPKKTCAVCGNTYHPKRWPIREELVKRLFLKPLKKTSRTFKRLLKQQEQ